MHKLKVNGVPVTITTVQTVFGLRSWTRIHTKNRERSAAILRYLIDEGFIQLLG